MLDLSRPIFVVMIENDVHVHVGNLRAQKLLQETSLHRQGFHDLRDLESVV